MRSSDSDGAMAIQRSFSQTAAAQTLRWPGMWQHGRSCSGQVSVAPVYFVGSGTDPLPAGAASVVISSCLLFQLAANKMPVRCPHQLQSARH